MKICLLHFTAPPLVGGVETTLARQAQQLARAGHLLRILAGRGQTWDARIPVEILPRRKHSMVALPLYLAELWHTHRALLGLVKKYSVDVIQTHLLRSLDFLVLSLRLQSPVRVFWTFHNARYELREEHLARQKWLLGPKLWGYQALYRLGARWAGEFVAVAVEATARLHEMISQVQAAGSVTATAMQSIPACWDLQANAPPLLKATSSIF